MICLRQQRLFIELQESLWRGVLCTYYSLNQLNLRNLSELELATSSASHM